MKIADQNRINMLSAVQNVVDDEKYQPVWKDHVAFSEGRDELTEALPGINAQVQLALGKPGAKDVKEQARKALGIAASEVIGAVGSYAAKNADPELAAKVDFSASEVVSGRSSEVVARCQSILAA